ncbi:hypothetical protein [Raoultella terrigena]|uniref:Uncharacterized protein n=1 Tax=Raoultella terrigena TaxID=577 RepID=A0AAP9XUD2_RAOTE|nr:hypothetical protein [Raoultella terrigena]QPF09945.1 hypothetical protein IMO34_05895 [Raoultella terrigena]
MRKHGVFLLSAIQEKRPDAARIGSRALLSLVIQARKRGGFGVTARRTPAINGQASNKQKNLMRKHGVFLLSAV